MSHEKVTITLLWSTFSVIILVWGLNHGWNNHDVFKILLSFHIFSLSYDLLSFLLRSNLDKNSRSQMFNLKEWGSVQWLFSHTDEVTANATVNGPLFGDIGQLSVHLKHSWPRGDHYWHFACTVKVPVCIVFLIYWGNKCITFTSHTSCGWFTVLSKWTRLTNDQKVS